MREAKWRRLELEATSTTRAGNSSRSVAIEFLSQIINARTRIRNVHTYVYIYIYENLDLDDWGGSRFARPIIMYKLLGTYQEE